ncbi:MAG: SsrA-binding protein SmpB [Deltaproteobacteria bacterium]|nr:SsrA-binding protein SmpB [Deltaproteobacteria bacterium]
MSIKVVCKNPNVFKDYDIVERYEAGIVLLGSEVKSLRNGAVSIKEAYVKVEDGEAFLINSHIADYKAASFLNHKPNRKRKLLLKKREIEKIAGRITQKGFTVVPIQIYFKEGIAKIEIGVGRGKHKEDKREQIRLREEKRRLEKTLKPRI